MNALGKTIRQYREKLHMSREDLAQELLRYPVTIELWERGDNLNIEAREISAMEKIFGCESGELFKAYCTTIKKEEALVESNETSKKKDVTRVDIDKYAFMVDMNQAKRKLKINRKMMANMIGCENEYDVTYCNPQEWIYLRMCSILNLNPDEYRNPTYEPIIRKKITDVDKANAEIQTIKSKLVHINASLNQADTVINSVSDLKSMVSDIENKLNSLKGLGLA